MEILKTIGLTEQEVRKISPSLADSMDELESLSLYTQQEGAPPNIKETYKSLSSQIERYMLSPEFKEEAKKAGFTIKAGMGETDEVVVAEMPKVKSIRERIAERKGKKAPVVEQPVVEKPTVEPVVEEPVIEETPVEEPKPKSISERIAAKKQTPAAAEEPTLFGIGVKGEKGSELMSRELFSTMLAYGRSDYMLGLYEDINGFHYRLDLPLSMGQAVISFRAATGLSNLTSILDVWKAYSEDNSAVINLVSKSEEQVNQLSEILGYASNTKERIPITETQLKDAKFNPDMYDTVNEVYSRSLANKSYFDISKEIKLGWENSVSSQIKDGSIMYGLDFGDYVYMDAQRVFGRGGSSIVVKKNTYYVPKGLTVENTFADIGRHLKDQEIKTSKFEKDLAIGKRFQIGTDASFDDALTCRIIASESTKEPPFKNDKLLIVVENGKAYKISRRAYNYFKHYYGNNIYLRFSKETVLVYEDGTVVGLIATKKYTNQLILGMFDYQDFENQIRTINPTAFDFMISEKEVLAQETEKEIVDIEEEEKEDKVEEPTEPTMTDVTDDKLIDEIYTQLDFLEETYEDAVEDADNQALIDELELELDDLYDTLEDRFDELIAEATGETKELLEKGLEQTIERRKLLDNE